MRKTKIVCTLGPASKDVETLKELIKAGMNVARINFSHGNYDEQKPYIDAVKKARAELNIPVALLLDTQGPEIRTGILENNEIELKSGQLFSLIYEDLVGNNEMVSVSYKELYKDIKVGAHILIDDGKIELEVKEIHNKDVVCEVINGGTLGNRKSIIELKSKLKRSDNYGNDYVSENFSRSRGLTRG